MAEESKYLDKTESCYETEYTLCKDIHYRKGEILKLEHINAMHCLEIRRLNARISTILKSTPDVQEIQTINCDQVNRINELKNLFEYLKALLINFSRQEGNAPIDPDDIDVKYIEAASRYCFPVLFDKYAILDQEDTTKLKIQFAEYILRMFGLTDMYKYENLHTRGEIDLEFIDRRNLTQKECENVIRKICICSAMEAGEFVNKYCCSERPETINWVRNSDGTYETGTLRDEEVNAKVRCKCGEYMKTVLGSRYDKMMIASCSCDFPKPDIMECYGD